MRQLAVVVLAFLPFASLAAAEEMRSIRVSAQSEIKVPPDEVFLYLAVETRDEKLLAAKRDNDFIAAALFDLMPKHAIRAEDVQLTDVDVSPDYGGRGFRESRPIAYEFKRSIEVRMTDFSKIEPLLADAFEAGLTHINGIHFRVSNQMKQQFEARRQAVEIAREKALHLTELTGMTLGSPIRIEEDIEHNWDTGGAGMMARKPSVDEQDDRPRLPEPKIRFVSQRNEAEAPTEAAGAGWQHDALVAPGQIRIQARVTVEFQMKPK